MVRLPYECTVTLDAMDTLVLDVVAVTIDDKWNIEEDDNHVFYCSGTNLLWCVLPLDVSASTCTCTELYVDRDYMDRLSRADVVTQVIAAAAAGATAA